MYVALLYIYIVPLLAVQRFLLVGIEKVYNNKTRQRVVEASLKRQKVVPLVLFIAFTSLI